MTFLSSYNENDRKFSTQNQKNENLNFLVLEIVCEKNFTKHEGLNASHNRAILCTLLLHLILRLEQSY